MKTWVQILTAAITGLLGAGILILVNSQPRGDAISLRPAPTQAPLRVYVTGAVQNPAVYQLEDGKRVEDAIALAGGLLENAYTQNLNLAAPLKDGVKISVSFMADPDEGAVDVPGTVLEPEQIEVVFPIDLNAAILLELEALPAIGPSKAQDIITYRDTHGSFTSIEQIQNVYGIGPGTFDQIKDLIYVNP